MGMLGMVLALRFVRSATMDIFYADVFFFSKIALLACLYMTYNYSYFGIFLILVIFVTLMFDQPIFAGEGSNLLEWITPQQFDSLVINLEKKSKNSKLP